MFKEMRRKHEQLTLNENEEILRRGSYGVLSTISPNGYPYSTPLNYVYYQNHIYFHSALEGHKIENINLNDKVSFSVSIDIEVLPALFNTKYQSVIVFGDAEVVEGEEKLDAFKALIMKYSEQFIEQGMKEIASALDKTKLIRIRIVHMTGKKHQ